MTNYPIYAAYDLETTGIYPEYNEIIEIALILFDSELIEIDRFVKKALPDKENRVHKKARQINGYDKNMWIRHGAVNQIQLAFMLKDFFNKYEIDKPLINIGHRVRFDMDFINAFSKMNRIKLPLDYRKHIDILVLDETLQLLKYKHGIGYTKILSKNFSDILKNYGVSIQRVNDKHDAESDIDATIEVLRLQLMKLDNGFSKNIIRKV